MAVILSILTSVYNEEEFIATLLDRVRTVPAEFFTNAGITYEVIVVDNGSEDGSYGVVQAYADAYPNFPLRLFHLEKNQGNEEPRLDGKVFVEFSPCRLKGWKN